MAQQEMENQHRLGYQVQDMMYDKQDDMMEMDEEMDQDEDEYHAMQKLQ